MSTTATFTGTMRTRKVNGTGNYITNYAAQGYNTEAASNLVGIIHFPSMALTNKVITGIKFTVTSQAVSGSSRTVNVRRSNYQSVSQDNVTGANYAGTGLGTFSGVFNGGTATHTISGTLLTNLASYFSSGNNTITIYDSSATSSSPNNLCWTVCKVQVTYEEGVSEPTVSSGSVDLGTAVTISTNRLSSSATHTLTYSFGSQSGTIATNVGASVSWTPPLSLASVIPNAASGTCTITCETYYSGTLVGTRTCTLKLNVPSSAVPTISSVSVSEATSGISSQFGGYVQGKSTLSVSVTAAGVYSSTIVSYRTVIDGVTYTDASFISAVIGSSGSVTITATVTDSRGRSATSTQTITVYAYSVPQISLFSAERCNSGGTSPQPDGTKVRISAAGNAASVNSHNTISCTVYYKVSSSSSWTQATTITASGYSISATNLLLSPTFNALSSYDIRISLADFFTTVEQVVSISTKQVMMDLYHDGTGIAFGKVAETPGTAEFGWPLSLSEPLSIANGGTGKTTVAAARNALGLGNTSGALPIANGGTGKTTVAAARNALGLGNTSGALPVANGGTGQTTIAAARNALGLGNTADALPVANGGTGSTTAKDACIALGIFYAASLPATGTDGQICLVPVS